MVGPCRIRRGALEAVVVNPGRCRTRTREVTSRSGGLKGGRSGGSPRGCGRYAIEHGAEEPPYVASPHLAAVALSMIVFLLVALAASCARPSRRVPAPPVAFSKTPKSPQIGRVSSV